MGFDKYAGHQKHAHQRSERDAKAHSTYRRVPGYASYLTIPRNSCKSPTVRLTPQRYSPAWLRDVMSSIRSTTDTTQSLHVSTWRLVVSIRSDVDETFVHGLLESRTRTVVTAEGITKNVKPFGTLLTG